MRDGYPTHPCCASRSTSTAVAQRARFSDQIGMEVLPGCSLSLSAARAAASMRIRHSLRGDALGGLLVY